MRNALAVGVLPASLLSGAAAQEQVSATALASDPRRPQFHLLPARNWMNDPNGPIFFRGKYHMFFQYNPKAAVWGNMSWNHAISPDMLHWTHLPVALTPTPSSPDSFGVFSGTALQSGNRVYAIYTGTRKSTQAEATLKDGGLPIQETQCLAWSDDPDLVRWTKDATPILPQPPAGFAITGFRDPAPWKQGDMYYLAVGSGEAKIGGCVLLYRSRDLRHWEYLHKLTEGTWNGKPTANPCDDGEMWECPDFFELDGKHVLIYSTLGKVFWQSGTLDPVTMRFTAQKQGLLDLDAFYAPKTQLDARGRRILWGWVPERRPEDDMRRAGWSGMMSLPRTMNLDRDGTLLLAVLPETKALRGQVIRPRAAGDTMVVTLPEANGEAILRGSSSSSFDLRIHAAGDELMLVAYDPVRHMLTANGSEIALALGDLPGLHMFVDGSVLEVILGGRIGYTRRFYYAGASAPSVEIKVSGAGITLQTWRIAPISADRLTKPAKA